MAVYTKRCKNLLFVLPRACSSTNRQNITDSAVVGKVSGQVSSKKHCIVPSICTRGISSSSCLDNSSLLRRFSAAQYGNTLSLSSHFYSTEASHDQQEDFSRGYGGPIRVPVIDWRDRHNIDFKKFAKMVEDRDKLNLQLIDVRETFELASAGRIEDSINIPFVHLRSALKLDPDEFQEQFSVKMPTKTDDNVVLIDLRGNRSEGALRICHELGYTKVVRFPGGYSEWAAKNQLPHPPTYYEHGVPRDHWTNLKYDDLRMMIKRDNVSVIDVREPWEVVEEGSITNALNIPVGYLEFALNMSESDFEKQYGCRKPGKMDDIGFISWKGLRSAGCQLLAQELGYQKACHFRGGMEKYNLKRKEADRPWARPFPIPKDNSVTS